MASQLEFFLPANYTTHLLSSTRAANEGITVLEVWSIFPFAIKHILGIKRIFPCSFENKRMCLLTRVYGIAPRKLDYCTQEAQRVFISVMQFPSNWLHVCTPVN